MGWLADADQTASHIIIIKATSNAAQMMITFKGVTMLSSIVPVNIVIIVFKNLIELISEKVKRSFLSV